MDVLSERLFSFFEGIGVDAMHAATVGCIIVLISYKKDIENWREIRLTAKGLIISTAFATIVLGTISVLRFVGVIKF